VSFLFYIVIYFNKHAPSQESNFHVGNEIGMYGGDHKWKNSIISLLTPNSSIHSSHKGWLSSDIEKLEVLIYLKWQNKLIVDIEAFDYITNHGRIWCGFTVM
jgi:hypothetical protein